MGILVGSLESLTYKHLKQGTMNLMFFLSYDNDGGLTKDVPPSLHWLWVLINSSLEIIMDNLL